MIWPGIVEEKRFERRKNKNESGRKGEKRMKRMQGKRKRKQAGRQDQDNPARPRLE